MSLQQSLTDFTRYCRQHLNGDEKGEAQIFLDRLFTAFGFPEGLKGAGATCEFRIKSESRKSTSFADLVWKPRVLIEMKKAGEKTRTALPAGFQLLAATRTQPPALRHALQL